jgi:hypothetical protein
MDVELFDLTVDVSLRFTRRWKIIASLEKNASESRDSLQDFDAALRHT